MVEVVNIVGTGQIPSELDLFQLAKDIDLHQVNHQIQSGQGLYLKFSEDSPTVILATAGKYIITGADSLEEVDETQEQLFELLNSLGINTDGGVGISINNVVCTHELGRDVNLGSLAVALGFERVEYEPEQFPGLIFRPSELDAVLLIFSSGKLVITGVQSKETAETALEELTREAKELLK